VEQSKIDAIKQELTGNQKNTVDFASIGELVSIAKSSSTNSAYTKEDLQTYLNNPSANADKLRGVSDYFSDENGIYKSIINAFTNLPTLDNLILPSAPTLEKKQDKAYGVYFDKINNYADSMDIKLTSRRILRSVAKYGAYVGYERTEGGDFYIQTLPLDWCRIKYKIGNDYQLEFNFKYFDRFFNKEDLEFAWFMYPTEFKKLYNAYKANSKNVRYPEWQMIDIKSTVCILFDDDSPSFIPLFSGMFKSLLSDDAYRDLISDTQESDAMKTLVQEVPTDKDGNIAMPAPLVKDLHAELLKILPRGANGLTTPLKITDVAFTNQNKEKEDLLGKSERGVFINSGFTQDIFGSSSGHTGLNVNIETVTANMYAILEKIENMFNRKFKKIVNSKNYTFKLKFFRTTNINIADNFDRMFQLVSIGGAIQPLFSLMGYDVETYTTLLQIENQLGIKDLLQVPQSMHTASGTATSEGQPVKKEKDLTDKGQETRDLKQ
jgi:hypothetical protein